MKTVTLSVKGMSCSHCMKAIEGALKNINVTGTVSLENKTVEVDLDKNEVSLTTIREAIENQSFDVQ